MRQPGSPRTNGICSPSTAASADALPSRAWKRANMKSSMASSVVHAGSGARKIHDPVGLPAPSAIGRECLLPPTGLGAGPRPEEAHADGPSLECMLGVEGTDAVLEASDHGWIDRFGVSAVEPVDP